MHSHTAVAVGVWICWLLPALPLKHARLTHFLTAPQRPPAGLHISHSMAPITFKLLHTNANTHIYFNSPSFTACLNSPVCLLAVRSLPPVLCTWRLHCSMTTSHDERHTVVLSEFWEFLIEITECSNSRISFPGAMCSIYLAHLDSGRWCYHFKRSQQREFQKASEVELVTGILVPRLTFVFSMCTISLAGRVFLTLT